MRYRSRVVTNQSKRFAERKKTLILAMSGGILINAAIWLFVLVRFFNLAAFNIDRVEVSGADPLMGPKIEEAAMGAMQGSYLGLLSKQNFFIYPRSAVASAVSALSPQVVGVKIDSSRHTLRVKVAEKEADALVCAGFPDLSSDLSSNDPESEACYFADSTGLLYAKAPSFSGHVYNRYYIPDLTDKAEKVLLGSYATSSPLFEGLQEFVRVAKESRIDVEAVLLKEAGEYELYSKPSATENVTIIYFNSSRPLADQSANLVSFWAEMTRGKKAAPIFEYIDVRYGSHVYYRVSE